MNELSALIQKTRKVIPEGMLAAIVTAATEVVEESPKFSGQLRASTNIGFNSPDLSVVLVDNYVYNAISATASSASKRFSIQIKQYKPGDTIYISNNLPYADVQEFKYGNLMFTAAALRFSFALDAGINAAK